MSDLALGVDLSDVIARLAMVDKDGQVTQGIVASNRAGAIKDAAKKAIASAKGKVTAVAVALPSAADVVPAELAEVLAGIGKGALTPIAAGTAAAIAEHWCGAAQGKQQVITFSIAEHVTAGVLIDGRPWLGAHGLASSIGWLALNPVELRGKLRGLEC